MLYSTLVVASVLSLASAAEMSIPAKRNLDYNLFKRDGACGGNPGVCCGSTSYGAMQAHWLCDVGTSCQQSGTTYSCCPVGATCGSDVAKTCSDGYVQATDSGTPVCVPSGQAAEVSSMLTVAAVASSAASSASAAVSSAASSAAGAVSSAASSASSVVSSVYSSQSAAVSGAIASATEAASSAEASATQAASGTSGSSSASGTSGSSSASGTSGSGSGSGTSGTPPAPSTPTSGSSKVTYGTSALAVVFIVGAFML